MTIKLLVIKEPELPSYEEFCKAVSQCADKTYIAESLGIKVTANLFSQKYSWHTEIGNKYGWVCFSVRGYTSTKKIINGFSKDTYYAALNWAKECRTRRLKEISGGDILLEINV